MNYKNKSKYFEVFEHLIYGQIRTDQIVSTISTFREKNFKFHSHSTKFYLSHIIRVLVEILKHSFEK
jgi:hypothetical protein